jgi:cellulose synthase/poly-beta-1,6-N-acetylglucosamine synthase-like glycosyltransferase
MSKRYPTIEKIAGKLNGKIPKFANHNVYSPSEEREVKPSIVLRTVPIAIGIPMDELMFSRFFIHFLELDIMPWDATICLQDTYLSEARNKIHNRFLEEKNYDHLLMLDSDVMPPPTLIERLLAHDKAMVGGYYKKKEQFPVKDASGVVIKTVARPVVYSYENGAFRQRLGPGEGLEQVGGAGAGCWMMRRDAAEAIGKDPYGDSARGEDLRLCRMLIEKNIPMFVDWSLDCAHCGVFHV